MGQVWTVLEQFTIWVGLVTIALGLAKLVFVPLAVWFEARHNWRRRRRSLSPGQTPKVSVIVPAYNESAVIDNCLPSVLASEYPDFDVVVVDDGSTDDAVAKAMRYAEQDERLRVIAKPNGGKGSALNRGIDASDGEILVLVDADGVFAPDTIEVMVRAFDAPGVGAVCGDDRPVNLDRVQTRLLSILSHVGTGLVRRALSVLGCLIIVSGNSGAFRRTVVEEVGGLNETTIGEDLELSLKILRAGHQVRFEPRALVYAESPSTVKGLWKQRVRWARGLLQVTRLHAPMVGNPRYGAAGLYMAFNTLQSIIMPPLQVLALVVFILLVTAGLSPVGADVVQWILWSGVAVSAALVLLAIAMNGALRDLRFAWTLPLWPLYATFMACTMVRALWQETTRQEAKWNKLERTGVISLPKRLSGIAVARAAPVVVQRRGE